MAMVTDRWAVRCSDCTELKTHNLGGQTIFTDSCESPEDGNFFCACPDAKPCVDCPTESGIKLKSHCVPRAYPPA